MANKRDLKKDIRFLTEQVIMDSLEVAASFDKEADKKKVLVLDCCAIELY